MTNKSLEVYVAGLGSSEPEADIAICSSCGWRGSVSDCPTVTEGDWESGYYEAHECPKCEDGGCVDDYAMSAQRSKEWSRWCQENRKEQTQ